jgi:Family of unknown function (DUF6169)
LLPPYPLVQVNDNYYQFITDNEIVYSLYFVDYNYIFQDYPNINANILSINIEINSKIIETVKTDERIGITVVETIKDVFKTIENVVVYVCDNSDQRQVARERKFDFWFKKYNDGSIIKENEILYLDEVELINSLLIHKKNPQLLEIILAFKELNNNIDDK